MLKSVASRLRTRLLILVLLAVLPALGLVLYTAQTQRAHESSAVAIDALRLARIAAAEQELIINGGRQILATLARLPMLEGEEDTCNEMLADLLRHYRGYTAFSVIGLDGNRRCTATPASPLQQVSDREWFQQVLQTHDFAVGGFAIGWLTGKAILPLAYPVTDGAGRLSGVAVATLDLESLNERARAMDLPEGSTFTVLDRNGTALAAFPEGSTRPGESLADTNLFRRIVEQQQGTLRARSRDGTAVWICAPLAVVRRRLRRDRHSRVDRAGGAATELCP